TSGNRDFRDLDQLAVGDEMIVTDNAGVSFTYVVDSTEITGPYSFRVTYQTPASTATLFACHPTWRGAWKAAAAVPLVKRTGCR
ncbi:MAG: sortase, partial [Actinomycetota bacterium]|nr:sortase [Actinomycetota bacterium]